MRKIWVVERGEYSDYRVVGVYSSKSNAERVKALINTSGAYDKATVACWPLDPAIDELNRGLSQYSIHMNIDGYTEQVDKLEGLNDYAISTNLSLWKRSTAPFYKGTGIKDAVSGTVWAKDEKHAAKIANEFRVQQIALGRMK